MTRFSCVCWHPNFTVKYCPVPVSELSNLTEKAENGDRCHFFKNSDSFCSALSHFHLSSENDPETKTEAGPPASRH